MQKILPSPWTTCSITARTCILSQQVVPTAGLRCSHYMLVIVSRPGVHTWYLFVINCCYAQKILSKSDQVVPHVCMPCHICITVIDIKER